MALVLCISLALCLGLSAGVTVDVKTTSGTMRGQTLDVLGKKVDTFIGIPYAEPPVGALRFARTKPLAKPLPDVFDATHRHGQLSCFGGDGPAGEDCLNLNIWAPHNSTGLVPVMFWIYGGGLRGGSIYNGLYDGKAFPTDGVVFVAVNYRLGPLGFLYGGPDSDAPGNMGFYDQVQGLKWVRENIHLFGGDKDQITIFGESAGSWSVSALVLSPLTKGLFKRAILQSGADYHDQKAGGLVTAARTLQDSKNMAKHFNCTDQHNWVDCLRKVDAKDITNWPFPDLFPLDGTEFLPLPAQQAFKQLKYNTDVDIIAGCNHDEGSNLAPKYSGNYTEQVFTEMVEKADKTFHGLDIQKVKDFYLKSVNKTDPKAIEWAFKQFYGDVFMKCPTYLFAKQLSQQSVHRNVYFYELTYQTTGNTCQGVCHGSELYYVFGRPVVGKGDKLDVDFSREVMTYWTNFAKTGIPTTDTKWPKFNDKTLIVKDLNPHNFTKTLVDPFKTVCEEFWKQYFE